MHADGLRSLSRDSGEQGKIDEFGVSGQFTQGNARAKPMPGAG
jgi:hypothetical protein